MKRFEYTEIVDWPGLGDFIVMSTDPTVIKMAHSEAVKMIEIPRDGKIETFALDDENYYLSIPRKYYPSMGEIDFKWKLIKELCHMGWEPVSKGDSIINYAFKLEITK